MASGTLRVGVAAGLFCMAMPELFSVLQAAPQNLRKLRTRQGAAPLAAVGTATGQAASTIPPSSSQARDAWMCFRLSIPCCWPFFPACWMMWLQGLALANAPQTPR